MHEKRNFFLVLLGAASLVWVVVAWFFLADTAPLIWGQKAGSLLLLVSAAIWLGYALMFEDKLPDYLSESVSTVYYEADGVCFLPMVRVIEGRAELCIYFQNRFDSQAQVIIHLRPLGESFVVKDGWTDVHFAFRCSGGDFGIIHQPITVPVQLCSQVVDVLLAAVSYYPRSHGARLRKKQGMSCGSMLVDWAGAGFRSGVHEVSGEIELINPVTLHLAMPGEITPPAPVSQTWRQEQIHGMTEK